MASVIEQLPIDHESEYSDRDDQSINSSVFSETTFATNAFHLLHENGRTYHRFRDGEYWQPNDAQQNRHEAILHHMCLLTLDDALFLAPVNDLKVVLDVGTGTGVWAIDMADRFPDAQIIATDLSPQTPGMMPSNVSFEIDDCCAEWVYPEAHFDLIHIRGLFGSIADWPELYRRCLLHLKPGGYIEQLEWSVHFHSVDSNISADSYLRKGGLLAIQAGEKIGKTFEIAESMADLIREAGFEDVTERIFNWPLGAWSSDPKMKEIGRWNLSNWREGLEGWTMALFTRVLGWSYEQVLDYVAKAKAASEERNHHGYHQVRVVYARRPL